ncbi:WavE lipopolysaccharide synthesis family protein [Butyrivibrio sp. YAB3001]|uniref:WavE lipopolysaccharide synthesis family protein n=1 Tax=Butyrivibrio sp. YAB3001 TaxID=1520812 RepID=UPI0008F67983|nr:WavE lipopolysaccharide synthesis family protein [Butyrivibrio sp. YAB3001]SFB95075.1 WavE lipopolysaccharide synthesis [Butyrivibrio sp. YAB3001]
MIIKNELIRLFNRIEANTERVIHSFEKAEYAKLIGDINAYAKLLLNTIPVYTDSFFENDGRPIDVVMTASKIKDEISSFQQEIIHLLMESMELLSLLGSYDRDDDRYHDKAKKVCLIQGKTALLLRFRLFSIQSFEKEQDGVALSYVMRGLYRISSAVGDYYTLNSFYQYSMKKYLPIIECPDVAIIMQGPVDYENDFTLESLFFYRYIYPHTPIILSTWKGEISDSFRWMAEAIGITIVEREMPSDKGFMNIKLQLSGTRNGIEESKKYPKVRFLLKTRTDQRFFLPEFILHLKNLLRTFESKSPPMEERIVFLGGRNTSILNPFVISDFMAFGAVNDIEKLYSSSGDSDLWDTGENKELYEKKLERSLYENIQVSMDKSLKEMLENNKTPRDAHLVPESYIIKTYYENSILGKKLGREDDLLEHYWEFLRKCAVIVDKDQLLFYWKKYADKYMSFNSVMLDNALTFSVWLNMYYMQ